MCFYFLSASSLYCSHSSCVPKRSAWLINTRLCVSCRVPPKALLAPLAQAAVKFQTAWADRCLPNQSVLLSLISIFQTSIYFLLASQDQNSAELIINSIAVFRFHILPPPLLPESSHAFQVSASSWMWMQGGHSATALSLRYPLIAHVLYIKWSICVWIKNSSCINVHESWVCMRLCYPQDKFNYVYISFFFNLLSTARFWYSLWLSKAEAESPENEMTPLQNSRRWRTEGNISF